MVGHCGPSGLRGPIVGVFEDNENGWEICSAGKMRELHVVVSGREESLDVGILPAAGISGIIFSDPRGTFNFLNIERSVFHLTNNYGENSSK